MTLDNFQKVLDAIGPQLRRIYLWNQGEPLLNKALPDMIHLAHQRGIYTVTSTNGQLLAREDITERLVQSGLDALIVSVDGLTSETYEIYRVGGKLQSVVSGMQMLHRQRELSGAKRPKIILQWLPMKHNEAELSQVRMKALEWGADFVEVKTTQIYEQEQVERFLPRESRLSRYKHQGNRWELRRKRESCRRPWFSCQIDWDGTVVPCCFDKDETLAMGNILQRPLFEIWHGKKYGDLRKLLLKRGRVLEICRNCTEGIATLYVSRYILSKRPSRRRGMSLAVHLIGYFVS
jgi:radical SAM protein with 4Fe4S-binding SPASM domain